MIRLGKPPYLECSTIGDARFSAFRGRITGRDGHSIERIYQGFKIFPGGVTGLPPSEAKGRRALNQDDCNALYAKLWDEYIDENPHLLHVLKAASGLSDAFGEDGHCCQATELWRIRRER